MTKHLHNVDHQPVPPSGGAGAPGSLLCGGLVFGIAGDRGVAVYPGQSAEQVLQIAAVIEREIDELPHYSARALAREILLELGSGARD